MKYTETIAQFRERFETLLQQLRAQNDEVTSTRAMRKILFNIPTRFEPKISPYESKYMCMTLPLCLWMPYLASWKCMKPNMEMRVNLFMT